MLVTEDPRSRDLVRLIRLKRQTPPRVTSPRCSIRIPHEVAQDVRLPGVRWVTVPASDMVGRGCGTCLWAWWIVALVPASDMMGRGCVLWAGNFPKCFPASC